MKISQARTFKLRPFFIGYNLVIVRGRKAFVLIAFHGGYHMFVSQFGEGWDFGIYPPQIVQGVKRFRGLHWQKVIKRGLDESLPR